MQPVVGGEGTAIVLRGMTADRPVSYVKEQVHAKKGPKPDEQRLFTADEGQTALEDETLPIGTYDVGPGGFEALSLAMQDAAEAAARRARRVAERQARAAAAAAKAAAAAARKAAAIKAAKVLSAAAAVIGAVLFFTWLAAGCRADTCNGNGVCSGFPVVAECACEGNWVGEYCDHECGCSGNGEQMNIEAVRATNPILDSATPQMVMGGDKRSVQMRIRGGASSGVLELNINGGGWDAVCDDYFNDYAATVFCRELGYAEGLHHGTTHGDSTFAADDIQCPQGAESISECSTHTSPYTDNCADSETVGLECSGTYTPAQCAAGSCTCEGNFVGEFCEGSCGDHGASDGQLCTCTGNFIGELCGTACGCSGHGNQTALEDARGSGSCAAGSCACEAERAGEFCQTDCCGQLERLDRARIEAGEDGLESCAAADVCSCGGLRFCRYPSEHLIGVLSSGPYAGKGVYGIPIDGPSTVANAEAACVAWGLGWLTFSPSRPASRPETQVTMWEGGCDDQHDRAQYAIGGEFCGACHHNSHGDPRCLNLATFVSDDWAGGNACLNPPGETFCTFGGREGMKALCIER
eukprot:COSAG04_NODE_879_length_9676_cov_154.321499_4_plen_582_part_00